MRNNLTKAEDSFICQQQQQQQNWYTMDTSETLTLAEKLTILKDFGTGFRTHSDPIFTANNGKIFKPFVKLGVYSFDEEELCHRPTYVRCNVPNCNQQFDTVFGYESHYNLLHRFTCSQCSKQLPSAHLLDLHLSEKHDSFFAVQAERKPMYACYLEECTHVSGTPAERHDHGISQHKFPHDFRFDGYNHISSKKKKSAKQVKVNRTVEMDQDIEPGASETDQNNQSNTSIATDAANTSSRKPFKHFSFGHGNVKTFISESDKSYAKELTKRSKAKNAKKNVLENDKMVEDLLESLPQ